MASQLIRSEGNIRVWSLLGSGDTARIEAMLSLYAELLPQYAHYVPRMRRRAEWGEEQRPGHIVHYWLVEVDGQPAALRTFRYVHERRVGLAHAMVVKPAYRAVDVCGQRLSLYLVHVCLEQVIADAKRLGDDFTFGIVKEVESSSLMDHFMKNGILELPLAYMRPLFPAEQPGRTRADEIALVRFAPMFLGILPDAARGIPFYSADLIANFALAFLVDHYGLPLEHPRVQSVLNSIPALFRRAAGSRSPTISRALWQLTR
ncbi:MAG: hypothetical protein EHM40_13220 [Chloroflexi bacterium]|nr:MAG: hypothetical protein EHM40_13220 [Chloroflexota bacterium]